MRACVEKRSRYGEENTSLCLNRLHLLNVADKELIYHKECQKDVTLSKIERIKQHFERNQANSSDKSTGGENVTSELQTKKPLEEQNLRSLRSQG